jgi:hypothetical protein
MKDEPDDRVPVADEFSGVERWDELLLEDLEDDLSVRARRGCIENGAQRLGGAALLTDDAAQILLVDAKREHPGGILASTLRHLDRVRSRDEVLRQEVQEVLQNNALRTELF